ncbi:hypothetical protein SR99_22285 [Enterobacter hormaechei subsp. steigerwaltii]|uniref:hypothetical protein n=1 Tax=Enterobacter hormaechei TaxID=158836 RepID=UPI0005EFCD49|nr:hypothetical protein [Enterobacter hormaechei]KJO55633.1 hypothetical protein SR99_22285 [Enterobacter hormaechei subsp. steigerwaltii]
MKKIAQENIVELVKLGHERAAELKASCGAVDARSLAQLISDLATQLEVQLVRGNAQAVQLANAESKCRELAAENAGLKSNLMYWNSEDAEPAKSPLDIAHESSFGEGVEFDVHVAARMPSMTYRVVRRTTYSTEIEIVRGGIPETPATDAFLAEVRASGVDALVERRLTAARLAKENGHEITARDLEGEAIRARVFAMELRKGVQS